MFGELQILKMFKMHPNFTFFESLQLRICALPTHRSLFREQGEFGVQSVLFWPSAGGCNSAHQSQDVHVLLITRSLCTSAALSSPAVAAEPGAPAPSPPK